MVFCHILATRLNLVSHLTDNNSHSHLFTNRLLSFRSHENAAPFTHQRTSVYKSMKVRLHINEPSKTHQRCTVDQRSPNYFKDAK